MHDGVYFESQNVPCVAILSDAFKAQSKYQAKILNASFVPQVFVNHPISDQSVAQMHSKASACFSEVFAGLTKAWKPSEISEEEKCEATSASAECST